MRRLLRRGADTLTDKQRARIEAALRAGDPDWQVTIAWHCAQRLRAIYHAPTPDQGRALAERLLDSLPTTPTAPPTHPTEAMNLLVEETRRIGHGHRNFGGYRLRLLLLCGVDWHTPLTPRIRGRRPRLVA